MGARKLNEEWTVEVIARMHRYRISKLELASKCHYSLTYISLLLNSNKEFKSEGAKERTKTHIFKCLESIEREIMQEIKAENKKEHEWYEYFNKT